MWLRFLVVSIFTLVATLGRGADGWLDDDPNAIWGRPPGFYKEGDDWYAIIHVKPAVTRVRLAGDFTDGVGSAIELTRTPDGKFWWFKGTDASFARPPAAGDKYQFVLNEGGGADQFRQDPAARRVENSGLGSNSLVTVTPQLCVAGLRLDAAGMAPPFHLSAPSASLHRPQSRRGGQGAPAAPAGHGGTRQRRQP